MHSSRHATASHLRFAGEAAIRDVLLVVKGVLYLVDLWSVETGLEYDESDVPKDTR